MALSNGKVSIGTAATLIDGPRSGNPIYLRIHNDDNSDSLFIGGATVTINDGYQLKKLESFDIILRPGNSMYAVSTKAGHSISYIKQDY